MSGETPVNKRDKAEHHRNNRKLAVALADCAAVCYCALTGAARRIRRRCRIPTETLKRVCQLMKAREQAVALAVYVTVCYCVLTIGAATTYHHCYRILTENPKRLGQLMEKGVVSTPMKESDRESLLKGLGVVNVVGRLAPSVPEDVTALQCGPAYFSSRSVRIGWLVPIGGMIGGFVFLLLEWARSKERDEREAGHPPSNKWGLAILGLFVAACNVTDIVLRDRMGLPWHPSTTILVTACYYGALFWFIVRLAFGTEFGVELAKAGKNREKCQALYDFNLFCSKVVAGAFAVVCITQGWSLSKAHKELYGDAGVALAFTRLSVLLIFVGSIGLLGWIGALLGGRVWIAAKALVDAETPVRARDEQPAAGGMLSRDGVAGKHVNDQA